MNIIQGHLFSRSCGGRLRAMLCMALLAAPLWSMDPTASLDQYIFNRWGTREGLPQLTVQSLVQSREGYIWIGTQEGLARFDGLNFTLFNHRNGALENPNVRVLMEDKRGRLWMGARNGYVTRYRDGEFQQLDPGLGANGITALLEDRHGRIWVGSKAGLKWYEDGVFTDFPGMEQMPGQWVSSLLEDRYGDIWIGTFGDGLLKYSGGVTTVYTTAQGLCENDISALAEDRSGGIWIGSRNNGLNQFYRGKITHYSEKDGLPSSSIMALIWDRDRNLWIGTSGRGLIRYSRGVFSAFPQEHPRGSDVILSILEDREGHVWTGSRSRGLERLADSRVQTLSAADGLEHEMVWSIYEDSQSSVWLDTDLGGIYRYRNGTFTSYASKIDLDPNATITSFLEGPDGALWISANNDGLVSFDGENTRIHSLPGRTEADSQTQPGAVASLYRDSQDRIWAAHDRVSVYEKGAWRHYPEDFLPAPSRCFYEDHSGALWVGTDNGPFMLGEEGPVQPQVENWPQDPIDLIYEDSMGGLWFVIQEGGLVRYKEGDCHRFGGKDGLLSDWIFSITEDDERNLWFSCNQGIFRVALETFDQHAQKLITKLNCQAFNRADGMKSAECNYSGTGSVCVMKNGELWYPTLRGVVKVKPGEIKRHEEPPVVLVESLTLDRNKALWRDGAELPPGSRDFQFHFTAFSYHSPKMVRFRYQLVGFDDEWVEAGNLRLARYSKLEPGPYRFRVIAANSDGVWNMDGAEFTFTLKPYFHQTVTFYVLCLIGAALLGFLLHAFRLKRHRQHEERLEDMVKDSTEELARTNEDLVTANRRLADNARQTGMAEIATEVLHNIGNTMNSANTSGNMMEKVLREDLDSRVVHHVADLVRSNERRLAPFFLEDPKGKKILNALGQLCPILAESQEALAEEVGIFLTQVQHIKEIVNSQLRLEPSQDDTSPFDPHQVVEDLIKMQAPYLRGIAVEVKWGAGDGARVTVSKSDFMQVMINLIKNAGEAIHMGPADNPHTLTLRSMTDGDNLTLQLEDSGCGIRADAMDYLFQHGYTTKTTGHGFGLHYCQKVVREMGGNLWAASPGAGKGATFSLSIPRHREAAS